MEVMHDGGKIQFSTVRLCGMHVISNVALDMCGGPH